MQVILSQFLKCKIASIAPKKASLAPSDGDVPIFGRPPSKSAFFDGDVPLFGRPPSLRPRKPLPSLRERDIRTVISRSRHKNDTKTSNLLRERDIPT